MCIRDRKEACETIGSVSVICSDKTGTLTQNRMTVEVVYNNGGYMDDAEKSGQGYFLENCLLNSTADIEDLDGTYKYIGSATECALLLYNKDEDYREYRNTSEIVSQKPFSSELKRMTTIIRENDDYILLSKGAPEIILNRCSYIQKENKVMELTSEVKNEILMEIEKLQIKSMRALGFAYKKIEASSLEAAAETLNDASFEESDDGLVFTGFVGIRDPLREDVKESVYTANKAHVEVKMLTGDNIVTAKAIGDELGLLKNNMRAVESSFIDTLSDEELQNEIKTISIVARSKPDTKMRIVNALQNNGEVVAVTGDGINDAPVLARADVGIAMGALGSDAAIEAADVVLMTDEPSKIAKAIEIARKTNKIVWQNIVFALGVKAIVLILSAGGVATMWEAIFADVGVALIAVLNAMRVMK